MQHAMQRDQHIKERNNAASGALIEVEGCLMFLRYTAPVGLIPRGLTWVYGFMAEALAVRGALGQVKSSQVANPHNSFCIEQRTAAKLKEAQVRVFGSFLPLPRLSPVGLIVR